MNTDVAANEVGMSAEAAKAKAESATARQMFDLIRRSVPFSQGFVLSALPRGSVQIVQPARCPETLLKAYWKDFHREDKAVWQALLRGEAVRGTDCWGKAEYESSTYVQNFLQPHGLRFVAAVPLRDPVLKGYPGVILLCRGLEESDFTDAEMKELNNFMPQLNEMSEKGRPVPEDESAADGSWSHQTDSRFFVFSEDGKLVYPRQPLALDERLGQQLQQHAQQAVDQLKRGKAYPDRLQLPDSRGDFWIFHEVAFDRYPALGEGGYAFLTLQPECAEWVAVRPGDVQADPELVRLLPALKFMQQEFHRNPTLGEIAKKAHLSPFHFHRRFTDLVGQTPKHFLLGCQIIAAKRLLVARKRELAQIATDCGFAHQSHFTSRFKQATGLTPTRWRRLASEVQGVSSN